MLHDVGKAEVPERILRKPGPLDESEWEQLRRHPVTGAEMLSTIDGHVAGRAVGPPLPRAHGRQRLPRWPRRRGHPLAARIMLVADAFDAMTSNRGYRRAMDRADALEELRRCAGSQFDPACVAALERHLAAAV
jgi:HD-GYP domain-containing protein (c-di-GMP phosphodiesterase class II)